MSAPYDEIADWYEDEFLSDRSEDGLPISDPIGVDGSLTQNARSRCRPISRNRLWNRNTCCSDS